jgi:hypothetical protein
MRRRERSSSVTVVLAGLNRAIGLLVAWSLLGSMLAAGEPRVFHVADFGAVGDGQTDDRAAIRLAIDAAINADGPATVRFEPGKVYRLDAHRPGNGMLIVSGAVELTLDGAGATLLAHPSNRILAIHASKRIVVRNLTLDHGGC